MTEITGKEELPSEICAKCGEEMRVGQTVNFVIDAITAAEMNGELVVHVHLAHERCPDPPS